MSKRSLLALPFVLLLLAGCTPIVALDPADDAENPACAAVIVQLPDTVDDLASRETDAQGTAAWGDPATVRLYCGVPTPDPTSLLRCYTIGGVDWLIDDSDDPNAFAVTYGRTPAVQQMALRAFAAVDGRGLARVDFFLTADGPIVNELNTMPGFTPISMFPKCWIASGMTYRDLISELIELGIEAVR